MVPAAILTTPINKNKKCTGEFPIFVQAFSERENLSFFQWKKPLLQRNILQ